MNKKKIQELIKLLKDLPDNKYDQTRYFMHPCGTPSCIAGWTTYLDGWRFNTKFFYEPFQEPLMRVGSNNKVERESIAANVAQKTLDLTGNQAIDLFNGYPFGNLGTPSIDDAVRVLENLLKTGEVEWTS